MDHEDYRKALEMLARKQSNPIEQVMRPTGLIFIFIVSLGCALAVAMSDGWWGLRPITWWEIIALIDTWIFATMYFRDLKTQTPDELDITLALINVGRYGFINYILLGVAALSIIVHETYPAITASLAWCSRRDCLYALYLLALIASFGIFVGLDLHFAKHSKRFTKVRDYWALLIFVDTPATIAFALLFIAYLTIGHALSVDIIAGAVVMQIMIADTLYVAVVSNWYNQILMNLCNDVTKL